MKLLFSALLLMLLMVSLPLSAQQNFDNYTRLISDGGIPADFTSQAYDKIMNDIKARKTSLNSVNERQFLEGIHYAINDLLHSGMVTYGDEVTMYVEDVASRLLANDENLRKELRFYTIKSNETNAFSTFQGIIFVTTGLISQLTSEAELAYILSHEIAHYTEQHVVKSFDWKKKNKINSSRIQELSNYSKEHEFEADKLALKRYHDAGYDMQTIMQTFDVLLYSYLPFDEIEFPVTHYNSNNLYIPESLYPDKKYPIKAVEDADDSKSSHPNIKRRKEAVKGYLNDYTDWGSSMNLLGTERFEYIRTICRFESVSTDVRNSEFDDALYSIFLLEKSYPNSIYLKRMKAKAWLGIAQFRKANLLLSHLPKTSEFEGEIATLQGLLRNLNKMQTSVVAMRVIEDLRLSAPGDTMLNAIWSRMVKTLAQTEKFKLEKFNKQTFEAATHDFYAAKVSNDSLQNKSDTITANNEKTKYDRIKKKVETSKSVKDPEAFDSTNFYLYAIGDLLQSDLFLSNYEKYQKEQAEDDQAVEDFNNLSLSRQKKLEKQYEENQLRLDQSSVIYIEPLVLSYSHGRVNRVKSEKLAADFTDAIISVSNRINLNVITIASSRLSAFGTEGFNERSLLTSYLSELTENENIDVFPTDYMELQKLRQNYGTDKVLFSLLEHSYQFRFPIQWVCTSIILYPALFVIIPLRIFKGNETELSVIVLDLDQGAISGQASYSYHEPINKHGIKARVYDLLTQVKSKPIRK